MSEEKKLTAKELKALRRAEKVAARPGGPPAPGASSATPDAGAPGPSRPATSSPAQPQPSSAAPRQQQASSRQQPAKKQQQQQSNHQGASQSAPRYAQALLRPQLFQHLDNKKRISSENIPKDIHPAIFTLALRYSSGTVSGSNARCVAMLQAFKDVIRDYVTPNGTTLARNLSTYLSLQISYLVAARPLSVTMGTAIRYLKREISTRSIDKPDDVLKEELHSAIETFVRERIDMSRAVIARSAAGRIRDGDVVLVYAHSTTVLSTLREAVRRGRTFAVVVVDSRPRFEGRKMLSDILAIGSGNTTTAPTVVVDAFSPDGSMVLPTQPATPAPEPYTDEEDEDDDDNEDEDRGEDTTRRKRRGGRITRATYVHLSGLDYVMPLVTKVLLGAHALLANGALYSRAGTAVVACAAHAKQVPCVVLAETYKFSERVLLDSFVMNEIGPDAMLALPTSHHAKANNDDESSPQAPPSAPQGKTGKQPDKHPNKPDKAGAPNDNAANPSKQPLSGEDLISAGRLTRLDLLYDVTPAKYLTLCVSELGSLPTTAVPAALREQSRDLGIVAA
ncbi:hypothetical protein PYCC9005_005980 [Savitreella phatthalungensis]